MWIVHHKYPSIKKTFTILIYFVYFCRINYLYNKEPESSNMCPLSLIIWVNYRKWRRTSSTTSSCRSSRETDTTESSLPSPGLAPWQRLTGSMWTDVQYSSKRASRYPRQNCARHPSDSGNRGLCVCNLQTRCMQIISQYNLHSPIKCV